LTRPRLSPRQLAEFGEASDKMDELAAEGDASAVWEANLTFHRCLNALSGNPLEDAGERIWDRFAIAAAEHVDQAATMCAREGTGPKADNRAG
jgi:DNA-binding GntR family transcriptional regulator